MSQADLFDGPKAVEPKAERLQGSGDIPDEEILCRPIQHRLDRLYRMVAEGYLMDAHIEAKVIESETASQVMRERCDRLATALWDARLLVDAWRVIERKRKASTHGGAVRATAREHG